MKDISKIILLALALSVTTACSSLDGSSVFSGPAPVIDQNDPMSAVKSVLTPFMEMNKAYAAAKEDDKLKWDDLLKLGPTVASVTNFKNYKLAETQWKNSTADQRTLLIAWIQENFSLGHKKTERDVEAALAILVNAAEFFQDET